MKLLVIVLLSALISLVSAQCDVACQAYVWGFPLWHAVNQRYIQAQNSPTFQVNSFAVRVSNPYIPGTTPGYPQLALCNATLCSGSPWVLNPSPVVAPNFDTIYGGFTWDLGTSSAYKFALPYPNAATGSMRYISVIFYDFYTNVLFEYSSLQQQPGISTVLCLAQTSTHPACRALAGSVPATTTVIPLALPRYGFAIIRGYSAGNPNAACGVDGCLYLLAVNSQTGALVATTNPKSYLTTYTSYMNNAAAVGTSCPYAYGQPTCGLTGNKTAFWAALCVALADNPVTGNEATYVENNFGSLGIHASYCDASIDYARLNAGIATGYAYVASNLANTGVSSGPWTFIPFSGKWNVVDSASALLRAITSTRLEYMNSNGAAAYWTAFTDSDSLPLNAAWGVTYKLVWQDTSNFTDSTFGFWSVTAYDSTQYPYNPPSGTDNKQYAIRGTGVPTGEIHISTTCINSANCIRVTPGPFSLMLRAYAPLSNIQPNGGYQFPTLFSCNCGSPCY